MDHLLAIAVTTLIENYGYLALFLVIGAETAGAPVPGEIALLLGGFLAEQGHLHLSGVVIAATLAVAAGGNLGFALGERGGQKLLEKWGHRIFLPPHRLVAFERHFEKHGNLTVFFARFVIGWRVICCLVAGAFKMDRVRFNIWNALGGLSWSVVMSSVGYFAGANYKAVAHVVGYVGLGLLGALILGVGMLVFLKSHSRD